MPGAASADVHAAGLSDDVKPAQQGGGTGCLGLLAGEPVVLAGGQAGEPDREMWDDKTILLCYLTGSCVPFPGNRPGPTNIDPALSPDGNLPGVRARLGKRPAGELQPGIAQPVVCNPGLVGLLPDRRQPAPRLCRRDLRRRPDMVGRQPPGSLRSRRRPAADQPVQRQPGTGVKSLFQGAWPNYYYNVDWRDQFAWSSRR